MTRAETLAARLDATSANRESPYYWECAYCGKGSVKMAAVNDAGTGYCCIEHFHAAKRTSARKARGE